MPRSQAGATLEETQAYADDDFPPLHRTSSRQNVDSIRSQRISASAPEFVPGKPFRTRHSKRVKTPLSQICEYPEDEESVSGVEPSAMVCEFPTAGDPKNALRSASPNDNEPIGSTQGIQKSTYNLLALDKQCSPEKSHDCPNPFAKVECSDVYHEAGAAPETPEKTQVHEPSSQDLSSRRQIPWYKKGVTGPHLPEFISHDEPDKWVDTANFDDRWLQNPEDMWNKESTRTSSLMVSPTKMNGEDGEPSASGGSSMVLTTSASAVSNLTNSDMDVMRLPGSANMDRGVCAVEDQNGCLSTGGVLVQDVSKGRSVRKSMDQLSNHNDDKSSLQHDDPHTKGQNCRSSQPLAPSITRPEVVVSSSRLERSSEQSDMDCKAHLSPAVPSISKGPNSRLEVPMVRIGDTTQQQDLHRKVPDDVFVDVGKREEKISPRKASFEKTNQLLETGTTRRTESRSQDLVPTQGLLSDQVKQVWNNPSFDAQPLMGTNSSMMAASTSSYISGPSQTGAQIAPAPKLKPIVNNRINNICQLGLITNQSYRYERGPTGRMQLTPYTPPETGSQGLIPNQLYRYEQGPTGSMQMTPYIPPETGGQGHHLSPLSARAMLSASPRVRQPFFAPAANNPEQQSPAPWRAPASWKAFEPRNSSHYAPQSATGNEHSSSQLSAHLFGQQQDGMINTQNDRPNSQHSERPIVPRQNQQAVLSFVPSSGPVIVNREMAPNVDFSNITSMPAPPWRGSVQSMLSSAPMNASPRGPHPLNPIGHGRPEKSHQSFMTGSSHPVLSYHPGIDTMFPVSPNANPSAKFHTLLCDGLPTYRLATMEEYLPFCDPTAASKPATWGVIKITNIPYDISKQAIYAFLGKNAKIITPDIGEAIHITMDRISGKTLEVYVEFFSRSDAQAVVNKMIHQRDVQHRHIKLGDRHVEVLMSEQGALMEDLFPKAKNVKWNGQTPVIVPPTEPYNTGFKSFITGEELVQMVKHAQQPHRYGYSQKCLCRTYENMISVLHKYPWFAVEHYTLNQRDTLYIAVKKQLQTLVSAVRISASERLTTELLTALLHAGLNAPGFGEKQKWELYLIGQQGAAGIRISPLSASWPFQALGRKQNWEEDVVMCYAQFLNAGHVDPALLDIPFNGTFDEKVLKAFKFDPARERLAGTMKDVIDFNWKMLEITLKKMLTDGEM